MGPTLEERLAEQALGWFVEAAGVAMQVMLDVQSVGMLTRLSGGTKMAFAPPGAVLNKAFKTA